MEKLYIFLYVILYIILLANSGFAYSGQITTNISVNITNNSVTIWNEKIGVQAITINWTNITNISKNYSWYMDYEYNLSGMNITILNYSQDCSYLEEALNELKLKVSEINVSYPIDTYTDAKKYYNLYLDCFSNYTVCKEYRTNNQEFKSQYDGCISIKDAYYQQNMKLEIDYYSLNNTLGACMADRGNYKAQRFIWSIVCSAIVGGLIWFFKGYYPSIKKSGKFSTSREISPDTGTINPDEVSSKGFFHKEPAKRKDEMIDPDDIPSKVAR